MRLIISQATKTEKYIEYWNWAISYFLPNYFLFIKGEKTDKRGKSGKDGDKTKN
jgi:hypothetical protein